MASRAPCKLLKKLAMKPSWPILADSSVRRRLIRISCRYLGATRLVVLSYELGVRLCLLFQCSAHNSTSQISSWSIIAFLQRLATLFLCGLVPARSLCQHINVGKHPTAQCHSIAVAWPLSANLSFQEARSLSIIVAVCLLVETFASLLFALLNCVTCFWLPACCSAAKHSQVDSVCTLSGHTALSMHLYCLKLAVKAVCSIPQLQWHASCRTSACLTGWGPSKLGMHPTVLETQLLTLASPTQCRLVIHQQQS